jgi:hypothetical protein
MLGYINKQHLKWIHFEVIRLKLIYSKNKFAIIEFNLTVCTLLSIRTLLSGPYLSAG